MFHLMDKEGNLHLNIWQMPPPQTGAMEINMYRRSEADMVQTDTQQLRLDNRTDAVVMDEVFASWKKFRLSINPNETWKRVPIADTTVDFQLPF